MRAVREQSAVDQLDNVSIPLRLSASRLEVGWTRRGGKGQRGRLQERWIRAAYCGVFAQGFLPHDFVRERMYEKAEMRSGSSAGLPSE